MGVKSQAEHSCKPGTVFWSWSPRSGQTRTDRPVILKVSPSSVFTGALRVLHGTLVLKHSLVQGGDPWSGVQTAGPLCTSLARHPVPHTDPLWVLPLVSGSPRVGAVEVMGEVPGTQKEDRLLSSGLRSLPMSTPGRPCSAHHSPSHAGGGRLPGPSCNSVAPFSRTAVHGNSIWLCIQAMRDAILLWVLVI